MKKNIPLEERQGYHGFPKKYRNVYLLITTLVDCGILIGITVFSYIGVSDIKNLSNYLTAIDSGVDRYDHSILQFFNGIVLILFVFLLGVPLIGIPIISFIAFTKGIQIDLSYVLSMYTYHPKGIAGIIMTLPPQVVMDLIVTFPISASVTQLSIYIICSTANRERLNFEQLDNNVLDNIFIYFVIILADSYLKSTLITRFIRLFNLMWSSVIIIETGGLQHGRLHVRLYQWDGCLSISA